MDLGNNLRRIMMKIWLDKKAYMPLRAHETDAGLDLRCSEDILLKKGESVCIDTGVHVEFPHGYYGKLESKSGLNVKYGIVSLGGTIDEGYLGSIVVKLYNFGDEDYQFRAGDKIIQMIIQPYIAPKIEIVTEAEIAKTDRGTNGFGSSGR